MVQEELTPPAASAVAMGYLSYAACALSLFAFAVTVCVEWHTFQLFL